MVRVKQIQFMVVLFQKNIQPVVCASLKGEIVKRYEMHFLRLQGNESNKQER